MITRLFNSRRDQVAIFVFVVFYIVFGIVITLVQEAVVYKPSIQDFEDCSGFAHAQKVTSEGTRMYFVEQPMTASTKKIAILYHGNGGSACDRAFMSSLFVNAGYSLLIPEYAGYSNDTVSPSHGALKADVAHVAAFVRTKSYNEVLIVGESIGTGLAAQHVSIDAPDRLILISPFTNLIDIAKKHFWYYPVSLMVSNAFDNQKMLAEYGSSVLVIHGNADKVIPALLGKRLYFSLQSKDKHYFLVEGAGHNDLFAYPSVYEEISRFIGSR